MFLEHRAGKITEVKWERLRRFGGEDYCLGDTPPNWNATELM